MREDNYFNVWAIITRLVWTKRTSMSPVLKKAITLNHSLTHFLFFIAKYEFLPEASFGLRVLSLPASVCVCVRARASTPSLSAR